MRARRISFVSFVPGMVVVAAFSLFAATQMHKPPRYVEVQPVRITTSQDVRLAKVQVHSGKHTPPLLPHITANVLTPARMGRKGIKNRMAVALPSGWVDTGITKSITNSGRVRINYSILRRSINVDDQLSASLGEWSIYWHWDGTTPCASPTNPDDTRRQLYADTRSQRPHDPVPGTAVLLANYSCDIPAGNTAWFTVNESTGPYRLGTRLVNNAGPNAYPVFPAIHYAREYAWFSDEFTVVTSTITGGLNSGTTTRYPSMPMGGTPAAGMTPGIAGTQVGKLGFGWSMSTNNVASAPPQVSWDSLVNDGVTIDTSELNDVTGSGATRYFLTGGSSGAADGGAAITANVVGGKVENVYPPWRVRYLLNITGHKTTSTQGNGSGIALLNELNGEDVGARLLDTYFTPIQIDSRDGTQKTPQQNFVSTPRADAVDFTIPSVSWATHSKTTNGLFSLNVDPVWAAAQDPPLDTADLSVPILTVAGRTSPSNPDTILYNPNGDGSNYFPVTINRANAISIQRPDAHVTPPSHWTSSDVTKLVVTDPDTIDNTRTKIVVSTVGAKISRSLVSHWRNWLVKMTPEFIVDGYKILVHNYDPGNGFPHTNEDIWAWPAYGYVRATVTMPVSATLTMTINGVYLDTAGSDNHHTGQARVDALTVTEIPYTKSYDVNVQIQTPNGTAYGDFDILMPSDKSGPFYPSRVDSISISGWPAGTCYLNDLALQAHGSGYFKCDYGPPRGRKMDSNDPLQQPTVDRNNIQVRFDAAHIAIDGSFVYGNQADQYLKGSEIGQYGGSVRFVEPLTGDPSGIIMDAQKTLANFVGDMAYVEGITTSYSQAVDDAANKDSFGNSLGGSLAQNMIPVVPYHQFTLGYSPPCAWPVKSIQITNGLTYVVRVLWPIQAGREGLAVTVDNLRANKKNSQNNIQPRVAARRKDKNLGGTPPGLIVTSSPTDDEGYYVVWPLPANGPDLPAITAPNYNPVPALIAVPYDIEPA